MIYFRRGILLVFLMFVFSCTSKIDYSFLGINCELIEKNKIEETVGFDENGFTYKTYGFSEDCILKVDTNFPISYQYRKINQWVVGKWNRGHDIKSLVESNAYFNDLFEYTEKATLLKLFDKDDIRVAIYYKGSNIPNYDVGIKNTMEFYDIYILDEDNRELHYFSCW